MTAKEMDLRQKPGLLSTYFTFEKLFTGAGETVELLRASTVLRKDLGLIPSTHVGTLTTAYNSSCDLTQCVGLQEDCTHVHTHTHTNIPHTHKQTHTQTYHTYTHTPIPYPPPHTQLKNFKN